VLGVTRLQDDGFFERRILAFTLYDLMGSWVMEAGPDGDVMRSLGWINEALAKEI